MADEQHTPTPMSDERLAEIHRWYDDHTGYMSTADLWVGELLTEVDRLRVIVEGSGDNALSWLIAVAKAETSSAAMREIVQAVAEAPIEVGTVNKTSVRFLLLRSDVRRVQEQARALLAQDEEQEAGEP